MLTFESLIEQAKLREMPATKMRGILREYLQILILKQLNKLDSDKKLLFTGGTYLRLVHNLKRFSEDLDFNVTDMPKEEFESLLAGIAGELQRVGLKVNVEFDHWRNIYVSKLIFPEIEKTYRVVSPYAKKAGIIIKVEANANSGKVKQETNVISGFGEFYPCLCTHKSVLFADKIDALTKKRRGRHIYDVIFMLANKYPIDQRALKRLEIKNDPLENIKLAIKSFAKAELKQLAESLRPFLFDESEANLVVSAYEVIPQLLGKYSKS